MGNKYFLQKTQKSLLLPYLRYEKTKHLKKKEACIGLAQDLKMDQMKIELTLGKYKIIFNISGVAGAVLQTALSLTHLFIH